MYLRHGPETSSRSTFAAPVKAPKKRLPVSTAIGAERTIVGVPTLPTSASTAFGPRTRAPVPTGASPVTTDAVVDGQRAGEADVESTSRSERAADSALCGWY